MQARSIASLFVILILGLFGLNNSGLAQEDNFMHSGKLIFTLQLAAGQVRVADTNGTLPSVFFPYQENGVDVGIGYGLNNTWAASLSGNIGFSAHKRTAAGTPNDYSENVKTSSWGIRGGLDAYFQVSDKFVIFAGPGVRYSRSKVKLDVENTDGSTGGWDNPWFSSLSLSGRLGGMINLAESFAIYGSFGQQFSYSWFDVNSGGVDQTWKLWHSAWDARMGVALYFGGQ
jgi:hypothetical protein